MEELTNQELVRVNGGNLFAMLLGVLCGIGDNLTDNYKKEVMDTIESGNICDLVD